MQACLIGVLCASIATSPHLKLMFVCSMWAFARWLGTYLDCWTLGSTGTGKWELRIDPAPRIWPYQPDPAATVCRDVALRSWTLVHCCSTRCPCWGLQNRCNGAQAGCRMFSKQQKPHEPKYANPHVNTHGHTHKNQAKCIKGMKWNKKNNKNSIISKENQSKWLNDE